MTLADTPHHLRTVLHNRIPEVTLVFWMIKVLSTTTGETAADYLSDTLGFGLARTTLVMSVLLAVALAGQFATRRYRPPMYWTVVVLISVVGTLVTDNLTDVLGVSLWVSTGAFLVLLGVTFAVWYAREGTLSIHTVFSRRREAFYWVAILFTFALGTAAGDLLSETLSLGYGLATLLFVVAIGLVVAARYALKANAVACFWIAYVLTRPLGASAGDLLAQARGDGGLGLGTTSTSIVFLAIIVALTVYLTVRLRGERQAAHEEHRLFLAAGSAVES